MQYAPKPIDLPVARSRIAIALCFMFFAAGCATTSEPTPPTPVQPRAAAPAPQPARAAAAAPKPTAPVIERLALSNEVLFDFDSAALRPAGRAKLEELAAKLHDAQIDRIDATGYADRIGSESYNQTLSKERAQAVEADLEKLGIASQRVHTLGRGKSDPVTGDHCGHMGPENRHNAKLVACLQPDRRVEIEVRGARKMAALPASAS
jgi:OmpA-OmpF porin, OOP family